MRGSAGGAAEPGVLTDCSTLEHRGCWLQAHVLGSAHVTKLLNSAACVRMPSWRALDSGASLKCLLLLIQWQLEPGSMQGGAQQQIQPRRASC